MLAPASDRNVQKTDNLPERPALAQGLEAMGELNVFLKETPAITALVEAKTGAAFVERSRIAIDAIEKERTLQVGPLNAKVASINGDYRLVRDPLERVLKELRRRLTDYGNAVEAARIAEANRLAAERTEAERIAREAEAREADAKAAVDVGACEDVGDAIAQADAAFKDFEKADRAAAIAAKNVPVRLSSAMGNRALSMRTVEVLAVEDAHAAIEAMGITPDIEQAILKSARAFYKAHNEVPPGISLTHERRM